MKLREIFETASVEHEKQIPGTDRIADVVATFTAELFPFGKGLIVEIQHKHDDKEIGPISWEYLNAGYSVFWAYQSDFEGHDMTFAEHRVKRPWPHAVPLVEGVEGYPASVQRLLEPDPIEEVRMEVSFPAEYLRAHALEVIPPLRGYYDEGQSPAGWERIDTVSLHGKGRERAWVNVLRSPSNHIFLEFWKRDAKRGNSEYLITHIGSEFPERFEAFMEDARMWFKSEDIDQQVAHWVGGASVSFRGTTLCESWLSLVMVPFGPVKFVVARRDTKGNTRTWAVNYRRGDLGRLAALRHPIRRLFGEELTDTGTKMETGKPTTDRTRTASNPQ
ncbi:hypothetical protein [Haloplanus halophilus]|uniref:hypothetical protein n=1 Tax=Haloplanus halophilus TaxID=2949993 RepID=UPI00203B23EF|nr:hypothetical protein [Haloplanus sp. GDY1]